MAVIGSQLVLVVPAPAAQNRADTTGAHMEARRVDGEVSIGAGSLQVFDRDTWRAGWRGGDASRRSDCGADRQPGEFGGVSRA